MRDVLDALLTWWHADIPVGLATVTATWSSAPRQPGAAMVVGPDGEVVGSVSGGCVEGAVYELCREVIETGAARTARFGVSDDDAFEVGLTCGGTIELLIERVDRQSFPQLPALARAIAEARPVALLTRIPTVDNPLVVAPDPHSLPDARHLLDLTNNSSHTPAPTAIHPDSARGTGERRTPKPTAAVPEGARGLAPTSASPGDADGPDDAGGPPASAVGAGGLGSGRTAESTVAGPEGVRGLAPTFPSSGDADAGGPAASAVGVGGLSSGRLAESTAAAGGLAATSVRSDGVSGLGSGRRPESAVAGLDDARGAVTTAGDPGSEAVSPGDVSGQSSTADGPAFTGGSHLLITPDGRDGTLGGDRIDDAATDDGRGLLAAGRTGVLHYGPSGERRGEGLTVLVASFAPPARMLVFGATDHAAATARIGSFLGYHVTVCDARPVFATTRRFPSADEVVVDWPHRYLTAEAEAGRIDERTVLCVLTHDPKFDVPVLEVALRLPVAYVGAMGSRRTHDDRNKRLQEAGVPETDLHRLASPVGLDLGARTPEETAVSIAAEIVALRWGGTGARLTATQGRIHSE